MLFSWSWYFVVAHLDVDERNNLCLQTILGCLDDDNELLTHLWSDLQRDLLLQFFRNRILDEPAIEFNLGIFNE